MLLNQELRNGGYKTVHVGYVILSLYKLKKATEMWWCSGVLLYFHLELESLGKCREEFFHIINDIIVIIIIIIIIIIIVIIIIVNKSFNFFRNMFYTKRIEISIIIVLQIQSNPMSSNIGVLIKIYYISSILYVGRLSREKTPLNLGSFL